MSGSKTLTVAVSPREETGSSASRRLRAAGSIPAVLYGHGSAATSITLGADSLPQVLHHSGLIELAVSGGAARTAIVREVQRQAVSDHVLHVDFLEVRADEVIQATVILEPHGEPEGARQGGVLEQALHELEIECAAESLPESIIVDVSALDLDQTLHVSDLILPKGVKALTDADLSVFQVRLPREDVEGEEEGGEETAVQEGAESESNEDSEN